ncbi:MAG: serine hydrolase domain-containing protein, partial [Sphingomonadaceae bacterium]
PPLGEFLDRLAGLPLAYEPGSAYRYSVSLDVAGGLLEKLGGAPLDTLFERQLLGPLGMRDTGFHVPEGKRQRMSAAWAFLDPRTFEATDRPTRFDGPEATDWASPPRLLAGGAGLVSTAEDYAKFAQMLLNEGLFEGRRLLPAGVARLGMGNLLEPGVFFRGAPDRPPEGYGAGGSVSLYDTRRDAPFGVPAGVYGWGGAAGTLFSVDRVRQVAVVLMLQYMPSNRFPMVRDLATALNREAAARTI